MDGVRGCSATVGRLSALSMTPDVRLMLTLTVQRGETFIQASIEAFVRPRLTDWRDQRHQPLGQPIR